MSLPSTMTDEIDEQGDLARTTDRKLNQTFHRILDDLDAGTLGSVEAYVREANELKDEIEEFYANATAGDGGA